jgi:hypothetical protein
VLLALQRSHVLGERFQVAVAVHTAMMPDRVTSGRRS